MTSTERARLDEYERWLGVPTPSSLVARWLFGDSGAWVINGPLLRLPTELALSGSERVLDIGCGRGSLLRMLDAQLRFTNEPVGLDFSSEVLALGAADNARAGHPSAFVRGSAARLPFAERAFDLVLCGYVIKHLDDDGAHDLLDEIWRVLAPRGLAMIWDFAPTGRRYLDAWNRRWIAAGVADPVLRSTGELLGLARDAGFPFAVPANLHGFVLPPIPRASVLIGRPPED